MSIRKFNPLYVGIYLCFFNTIVFSHSAIQIALKGTVSQILNHLVVLLLFLAFFIRKFTELEKIKFWVVFAGLLLAYLCEYQVNGNLNLCIIVLVATCIFDFDEFDYVIHKCYRLALMISVFLIIFYMLGVLGRYYGFWGKNSLGVICFLIVSIKLYINRFYFHTTAQRIIWVIIGALMFAFIESRTASTICIAMIIFALINSLIYSENKRQFLMVGLVIVVIAAVAIYIYTVHMYIESSSKYMWLDEMTSGRYGMIKYYLSEYEVTPFGKYLVHHNGLQKNVEYRYLDSSYFQILLSYGSVFTVTFFLLYVISIFRAIYLKRWNCMVCLCANLIYGISELNLIAGSVNFILFSVVLLLSSNEVSTE